MADIVHFQYGRYSVPLKNNLEREEFLQILEQYIKTRDIAAMNKLYSLLTIDENPTLAKFILKGIADYPPSNNELITEIVPYEGDDGGIAVTVISSEALESGGRPHIACVINENKSSPF